MEIAEVGGERELHGLVRAEQLVEHLGDAGAPLAKKRPQARIASGACRSQYPVSFWWRAASATASRVAASRLKYSARTSAWWGKRAVAALSARSIPHGKANGAPIWRLRTSPRSPTSTIRQCQQTIGWADHLVVIYPLWLGSMPAVLKGFFEQVFRLGFAILREHTRPWTGLLNGKSARIIVTMGMPAWLYRWYFLAHSLKSLERNILRFSGIKPVRETLIGGVEAGGAPARARWIETVRALGYAGK
jgi:putative NADPH-quinone reductase